MNQEATTGPPPPLPALGRTLKQRALGAASWSAIGFSASQGVRFVTTLVMTRFLAPEMFGVMAIAIAINVIAGLVTDLGVKQNIVQSGRGDDPVFLNTAWTVQILRGIVVWVIAVGVAYALHHFAHLLPADTVYAAPVLPGIVAVSSLAVLIGGYQSTRVAVAERNLSQRRLVLIELSAQTLALALMVIVGAMTRSIWTLVVGQLAASVTTVALSHLALPGSPNRLAWDGAALREIVTFGKWIFVSSLVGVFALNADRMVLGTVLTPTEMGQFAIAILIVGALQGAFSKLYSSVVMPVLSETARHRPERLKEVFYRVRVPADLVLLFASGLLASTGSRIVDVMYDHRYADAGWMLQILALSLGFARYTATQELYLALGLPRYVAILNIVRFVSIFTALFMGLRLGGPVGAIWGIALHQVGVATLTYYFNAPLRLNSFRQDAGVLVALPIGWGCGEAIKIVLGIWQ